MKHTISGTGVIYLLKSKKRLLIPPNHIFVIERPGPYKYCYESGSEPWVFEWVSIAYTNPSGLLPEEARDNPVFCLNGHDELREQISRLVEIRNLFDYKSMIQHSEMAFHFLFSYLTLRMSEFQVATSPIVQKFKGELIKNYSSQMTISDCAKRVGYSHEAITRTFTREIGISPIRYLVNYRLHKACEFLFESNMSIKEIAFKCGFRSSSYFIRVFHKNLGLTPEQYKINPDFTLLHKFEPWAYRVRNER
ncbi:MAG: AraC family transcriptional regulator [Lentisphaerota bacterium]